MENDQHKAVEFRNILKTSISRRNMIKSGGTLGAAGFLGGASAL
ncbi:MAG: twin-arginine translocation signal domain-containing protein [Reinekea sp.]|nr:twin-arginine translocation signal domain-containing protein [Reinekea sp.]